MTTAQGEARRIELRCRPSYSRTAGRGFHARCPCCSISYCLVTGCRAGDTNSSTDR